MEVLTKILAILQSPELMKNYYMNLIIFKQAIRKVNDVLKIILMTYVELL